MRVKKDINLMRVARSRNNVNDKKIKNRETKKLPPKSNSNTNANQTTTVVVAATATTSQATGNNGSAIAATSSSNHSSGETCSTSGTSAQIPIESTVKMKKDGGKETQASTSSNLSSSTSLPKKLANSKLKSNQNKINVNSTVNKSGKTHCDEKMKKKLGKNNNSSIDNSSQCGSGGVGPQNNDGEKFDRKEDGSSIDLENNKKNLSTSITSSPEVLSTSTSITSPPGPNISSSSSNSSNNKNTKELQNNSSSGGDKKPAATTKKQTNKVCKELRNLGVSTLVKKDIDDKIYCRDVVDVKTSICEMVKTKSRINVQSTYNRKCSASEEPKDLEKSKKSTKAKTESPKSKKVAKKNKKIIEEQPGNTVTVVEPPQTSKSVDEQAEEYKLDDVESNKEKVDESQDKTDKINEKTEVDSKNKKKKKKEKDVVPPEREKQNEENRDDHVDEKTPLMKEKSKITVKSLDDLLETKPTEPAHELSKLEAVEVIAPPVVEEKLEDLEKLKIIDEIIIKIEQDAKVEKILPQSESTNSETPLEEFDKKETPKSEKEKKKSDSNVNKRKYVKKSLLTKKKKEPVEPVPEPPVVLPAKEMLPEIKDIYDFNESGNNSDSMDLSNIATKSSSSLSTQPPIYKRKLNSISKSSSFDSKSVNNLQLTTPELSNESHRCEMLSASIKNEIDDDKEKVKSCDEELHDEMKMMKSISEIENDSDESDEETLKSKINKSLKLAKAAQKKQIVKAKPKAKLTKDNVKKIDNIKKKSKKYVKTSSSDDSNGDDESDASSTLSLSRAKEQLKSAPTAKARKMKLHGFWSGPKRHRMASLNALAKVQCLYENESRSAQELGFVRPTPTFIPPLKSIKPPTPNTPSAPSDDEDYQKEDEKPEKKPKPKKTKAVVVKEDKKSNNEEEADEDEADDAESIIITNRSLRYVPGLRGAGKLWEIGSVSSISDIDGVYDSDKSYKGEVRQKKKKKKPTPAKSEKKIKAPPKPKEKPKPAPPKKKVVIKKPKPIKSDDDDDNDEKSDDDSSVSNVVTNKRKRIESESKSTDFKDLVVRKRMASLNASAILTATYEVERQLDKLENAAEKNIILSDDDSIHEIIIPASPKKVKEVKSENEDEDTKEQVRPVSTSVVIVQDTDVTITGVYVNSSLGSSQEAYCKMQYRVQSSVTEERVLRPTGDPPKSYTPLSALSNMRPPGAQVPPESCATNTAPSSRCETPPRHPPYHPSATIGSHPSMSAFCTPSQLQHHDSGGYYQPAGPLISSHLLPSQQSSGKSLSSPLENDSLNLQQPPQSTSAAESSDSDVLITGGDLTPRPQTFRYGPQAPGPYSRPIHQMHCPTYPPNYYSPYGQHPQDMCYSPPYQPYYPAKVYPAAGPYRRYIPGTYYQVPPSELYEPPPSNPPPPTGSQIVPAGPSGPQHMEHYPGPPYYGYSPGAAQCYSRGMQPYLESPYPSSCPCPMQSCPKNVHTGPLIGSNTSKGPVIGHLGSSNNNSNITNSTMETTCKTEDQTPVTVKPETTFPTSFHHDSSTSTDRKDVFEKVGLAPLPNYSVNSKAMEPDISISPARGSTGLPVAPTQITAAQPLEQQSMVRKARIGKNMVRERQHTHMMAFHTQQQNYDHQIASIMCGTNSSNNNNNNNSVNNNNNIISCNNNKSNDHVPIQPIKQEMDDIIKIENVKEEKDEVIMIIDKPDEIDEKPNVVNLIDDQSDGDIPERDDASALQQTTVIPKRRSLLLGGGAKSFSIKKASLKGYKNLIKRTEHKSYLSTPNKYPTKLDRTSYNNSKIIRRFNVKSGKIGKHRMLMKVRKVVMVPNKKSKMPSSSGSSSNNKNNNNNSNKTNSNNNNCNNNNNQNNKLIVKDTNTEAFKEILEKPFDSSSSTNSEAIAARGYYSESEIMQSTKKQLKTKKPSESRSKSESSRNNNSNCGGGNNSTANIIDNGSTKLNSHMDIDSIELLPRAEHEQDKRTIEMSTGNNNDSNLLSHGISVDVDANDNDVDVDDEDDDDGDGDGDNDDDEDNDDEAPLKKPKSKKPKQGKKSKKIKINKKKCKEFVINENVENNNNNNNINNNLIICDKVNKIKQTPATTTITNCNINSSNVATVTFATPTPKRNRSRTRKFSNKKRHRVKHVEHVEEVLMPRRANSIPKWSNGWSWEGEPFQGKIFLNSDDAPVLRTCYPAMRHSEGDVIRPRDCVLLRAGGKRFELPYVAKVAYLWENPEDGEMMMSLLWYYRPEHTEQGRQPIDSLDEVFASRHKDHNSVACIEDKCYVLTFSEYCRYRRDLKGYQEGIEETQSIVPSLYRENNRQVPPNTSPELVMFCRRVYEFRLKRLMKTPN